MLKRAAVLLFAALSLSLTASADEGMWMPSQVPQLASELKKLGLQIDPARLADLTGDPLGSVVQLPGCTAAFVSAEGLIATNHHCAFGSIQHNSTAERDLIADGFLARTREAELPAAPGSKVWVTTSIEDVTKRMTKDVAAQKTDVERAKLLDRREKELVAECEKAGGVRCRVAPVFEGSLWFRTTQAELTDVRLVYAPAAGIGDFGGDIDNFEWPRHTGDFSFYRAYAAGKPYRPKHWLKFATGDRDEGDLVIVAGYPGRTFRYKTADEVRNYEEFTYPTTVRYLSEVIRILEEQGKGDRDVQILNASRIASLSNSLKNYTSVVEGFRKDRIGETRAAREKGLQAESLAEIQRINAGTFKTRERDLILDFLTGRGSPMLAQAVTVVRNAREKTKPDLERLSRFQARQADSLKSSSERAQRTMHAGGDRAAVTYFLSEAAKLPESQRIPAADVATLYANTKIGDAAERTKMLGETVEQLKARNDAMLEYAFQLVPLLEQREERDLAASGAMARLRPSYFAALQKASGGTLYPDANSTLRLTFGKVEGYKPKDATWFTPQTTLRGIVEKETGKDPFQSPKALLAAASDSSKTAPYVDPEVKDVPVNYLSTCDTTGGNSGSPTLNANGEFIGLLFDGNYESIDADFQFNPADTRSIHVDSQYMLWVMDAVDGAKELMRELGVEPRVQ
ncbi:MAG TPA: S46 family peptidase [Thermoanaerobaculia bacterium]|nr:S46 family peptidase [Thermoanaerobaculia bacterium]